MLEKQAPVRAQSKDNKIHRQSSKMNYTVQGTEGEKSIVTERQSGISIGNEQQRGRIGSMVQYGSPTLSPLKLIQSPYCAELNLFDTELNMQADFKLDEAANEEGLFVRIEESEEQSVQQMDFPVFDSQARLTKDNMIEFLVDATNSDETRILEAKEALQKSNQSFLVQMFQYLYKRFKKSKKTKEEMIKYTMRKSFKFITDELKRDDPSLIPMLATDGLEGMSIYFSRHCAEHQIAIPFKKNSFEKTMNTAFLRKVFGCQRFYSDYKRFLKTFQTQFLKDNKKKITSMNEAVRSCLISKNFKNLDNYKRLPWTKEILLKLKAFAIDLLSYSPQKNGILRQSLQFRDEGNEKNYRFDIFNDNQEGKPPHRKQSDFHYEEQEESELYLPKNLRKPVIIVSPLMCLIAPPKMPDHLSLDEQ